MPFEDLDQKELYRSAIEDFAVDVKKDDSSEKIVEALEDSGVTWDMYVAQHPGVEPEVVEETTVKTTKKVATAPKRARTKRNEVDNADDFYLVKMNRDNPYFEFGAYRFTQEHPFVPMDADATNRILTEEDGFAIATPAEAAEYYA